MKTVRTGSRREKREIVCVTGAGGCVGQSLLKKLTNHGYHIKALFRHEDATARYWKAQGCEIIIGDLDNQEVLAALTKDATKVFHTAAIMTKDNYELSRHINVEGTIALYKAAAANQCQVFIFVSSISVYCGTKARNNIFTEEVLLQNVEKLNYYSRTKLEMEHAFPHLYKEYKLPFIIIRPTNIYGPLSEPWVIRIIDTFKKIPFSFSNIRFDLVYVDDVTDALIQASQEQKAYNQTFNVGGDMVTLSEYVKRLCSLRGIKVHKTLDIIDLPTRFFVDRMNGLRSGTMPSFTFSQTRFYPYAKAATFFHYQPKITLEDGLRRTGYWLNSLTPEEVFSAHTIFIDHLKTFHPAEIRTIQREKDIIDAMHDAVSLGIEIRAIGSMGSKNINFHTSGIALHMSEYNKLLRIEGELVTVQAGIKMRELINLLNSYHLALPTMSEWTGQTISGALSTATHGGSIHQGTIASSVHSIRIITPEGIARTYTKDDEQFPAIVVSFGIFGIISEVTFKAVPEFNLSFQTAYLPFHTYVEQIDRYNSDHDYFSALWIPATDSMLVYYADKTDKEATVIHREYRFSPLNLLMAYASAKSSKDVFFHNHTNPHPVVGSWDTILCPTTRFSKMVSQMYIRDLFRLPIEMEAALPQESALAVFKELRELFTPYASSFTIPIGFRFNKAEQAYLSPCFGRNTLWISVFIKDNEQLLQATVAVLKRYHARFHWGKSIPVPPEYLAQEYEHWDKILALKKEFDPFNICSNSFSKWMGL